MRPLEYRSKLAKKELTRQQLLDSYAHPTSPLFDIAAPLSCVLLGFFLYAWAYFDAWSRLGFGAFVASSAAVATQLMIEIAVSVATVFVVAKSAGFFLGEMWQAAFKVSAAVILFDAAAAWIARLDPVATNTSGGTKGYLNDLIYLVWFGCPFLMILLFRMDWDQASRAGPFLALAYGITNIIILVYLTKPLLAIGSFVATLANAPIPPNHVPLLHPHTIWFVPKY
jgi:hypothetical protein